MNNINQPKQITIKEAIEKLEKIRQSTVVKLKTETQLNASFNKEIKDRIEKDVYKERLYYNEIGDVKYSDSLSQTESSEVEREKRETIEKNITEVINEIKLIYSEF